MRKYCFITSCLLLAVLYSYAQGGIISGKITDSSGKNPLALSTVSVFKAKDTVLVTYRLSNDKGEFTIGGLPLNIPLRLLVTFAGYEGYRKDFTLTKASPTLPAGNIKMVNTSLQLDEVIVVAERPPIIVRKDTVEFNAASFKTLPNAVVEDLLKKLPGVQIDENGNIMVNGKRVNRILVDGKSFFGDDTKMATKNLPSALIDKVQVTDDKDEIALNNDGDLSKVGKVINLTMKKHVKRKWFGKLSGGFGAKERYKASANVNIMRDTFQVNATGYASNFNNGGQTYTPASSRTVSGNFNYTPSKKLSFSGQYSFRKNTSDLFSDNETQRFLGDTTIITNTNSQAISNNSGHNVSASGNWRPDSLTNLNFRVSYARNDYNNRSLAGVLVNNNLLGKLSNGNNLNWNRSGSDNISENLTLSYRARHKRGRSISLNESFTYSHNPSDAITESNNDYYYPVVEKRILNQLRNTASPSTVFNVSASYSDDLSKKWILRANTRFEYSKRVQDILTYAMSINNKYDSLNDLLSNSLRREHIQWSNMIGLGYRIKKVTVSVNGTWMQQWVDNRFGLGGLYNARQTYSNLFPSLSVNWTRYNLSISQNLNVPAIGQLIPVPDNSNPYFIRYGNPALLPTRQTSINLNGSEYKVKSSLNLIGNIGISFSDDAIIQKVVLNSNGVQTSVPINVDGLFNSYIFLQASKQFRYKQKFFLTVNGSMSGNVSRAPIYFNGVQTVASSVSINPSLGIQLDWNDRVQLNPKYTMGINKSRYSNQQFNAVNIVTHDIAGEITLRPTKKLILQSDATYRYNGQFASGANRSLVNWNAAISTLLFKESEGQLKLDIYDVLNSSTNFYSYINANSVVKGQSTVLQRFFMVSFIYNIKPVAGVGKTTPLRTVYF